MTAVENMNVSRDKPAIRFVGQTAFVWEVLQSAKRVLGVFVALRTRLCQALYATQNEAVPACDGSRGVAKTNSDDDPGRTRLIRFRTLMRDTRKPQRLFVPIAAFDFESFGVTVRRIAPHQRPPIGIVLNNGTMARSRSRPGIAAPNAMKKDALRNEMKRCSSSVAPASPVS